MATTLHILIGNHNVVDWLNVLALFVGQRLGIDFYVSRAKFLTTLRSHLDIACSCCFLSNSFNVDISYSFIYILS